MIQPNFIKADPKQTHVSKQWKYTSPYMACRFDPGGKFAFATAEDFSIQRFEVASGKKVSFKSHDSWIKRLVFSKDGNTLITSGFDGRVIWWPAKDAAPKPIHRIQAHQGWVRGLDISPDGKLLASGSSDNLVKIWNAENAKPIRELTGHEKNIYSILFHPDGKFLLTADLGGTVRQWDIATWKEVRKFDAKKLHTYNGGQRVDFGGVRTMAISPDKKYLACGGLYKGSNPLGAVHEPIVLLFEWKSQKLVRSLVAPGIKGVVWRVLFHPDGYMIGGCGGSSGGYIFFWKKDQDKDFHRLKMPHLTRDLDMHNDNLQLLTTHYDRHVRISSMTPKPKPAAKPNKKK